MIDLDRFQKKAVMNSLHTESQEPFKSLAAAAKDLNELVNGAYSEHGPDWRFHVSLSHIDSYIKLILQLSAVCASEVETNMNKLMQEVH